MMLFVASGCPLLVFPWDWLECRRGTLAGNRIDWNDGDCWIRLQNVTRPLTRGSNRIKRQRILMRPRSFFLATVNGQRTEHDRAVVGYILVHVESSDMDMKLCRAKGRWHMYIIHVSCGHVFRVVFDYQLMVWLVLIWRDIQELMRICDIHNTFLSIERDDNTSEEY